MGGIDTADGDPSGGIWADCARESRDGTSGTVLAHPQFRGEWAQLETIRCCGVIPWPVAQAIT